MKAKGVRMSDVSRETGISYSTFTDWKTGRYTPKAEKMQKIADFFGVTVDYLMTGEAKNGYYLNEETAREAQELFENPDMRILFSAARGASPEQLHLAAEILRRMKSTNDG